MYTRYCRTVTPLKLEICDSLGMAGATRGSQQSMGLESRLCVKKKIHLSSSRFQTSSAIEMLLPCRVHDKNNHIILHVHVIDSQL